jgi:hypothetical protein
MAETILAIFDDDIAVLAISYALERYLYAWVFFHKGIGIRSFTTFDSHGIIVNRHIAVLYQHILHHVKIYGICGRTFRFIRLAEAVDSATKELDVF